jgi:3-oxoacyl-[acyl-carrier-protein] synthase II
VSRIAVQGIGVVGGFGCGVDALGRALAEGGVQPGSVTLPMAAGPVEMPAFLADTAPLKDFIPVRTLRRIDHFSRLAMLGAHLALADAGLPDAGRAALGVVIATGHGATGITFAFQDSFINDGDICASPTHFANSVHNSAAANISIMLGATGPSLTVSQFNLSVPSALLAARLWLLEGRVDRVLFGAVDELSRLTAHYWYRRHGAAAAGARPEPLRTGADSAIPGEGAAFLLLSRAEAGDGPGYCTLDAVAVGRKLPPGRSVADPGRLLVLGADGLRATGARYAAAAAGGRIACFTPLYGSMPPGPAFDVASAALALRAGALFPTPSGAACDFPATVAPAGEMTGVAQADLLTLDDDDGHGLISLGRP